MTPSKAKELIELYVFNMPEGLTQGEHEVSIFHFLQTPQAAALLSGEDWKEDWAVETLREVSKILIKYHSSVGETEVGNHCFNIIREAAFKNKSKGFPDNITK